MTETQIYIEKRQILRENIVRDKRERERDRDRYKKRARGYESSCVCATLHMCERDNDREKQFREKEI